MENTGLQSDKELSLEQKLVSLLMRHCGERGNDEGAYQTLNRIIYERDVLLKNAIKEKVFKLL